MEALRQEEVLAIEEALLKKLEERLSPLLNRIAVDAAKYATNNLRLDLMTHISRHEATMRRLVQAESAHNEVAKVRHTETQI